ncbi:tetratricopeptide repeat-containing sensor histidine kinase [Psychroserpens damuponensis]|uniref:tetratricopeptide repeat-containing sensor histidine kinase n=1 Tax=Psychroserpens damuponensis TaxID=943936 RepID=UPI00058BC600|nr:ATP-binding protein [Psychroserpens damuponensis]
MSIYCYGQEHTSVNYTTIDSLFKQEHYRTIISLNNANKLIFTKDKTQGNANFIIAKSYENLNKEDSALVFYQSALKLYKNINDNESVTKTNLEIYLLLDSQNSIQIDKNKYLNEVLDYANNTNSNKWLAAYYSNIGINHSKDGQIDSAKVYYNKTLSLARDIDSAQIIINTNLNLGSLYSSKIKNQDSAIYHYDEALRYYYLDTLNYKNLNIQFNLYNNLGNAYRRKKDYQTALTYYNKAEIIDLPKFNKKSKKILYSNIEATYYYMKKWENAYDYLYKYDSIKDIINLKDQNSSITDIEKKYENEQLKVNNLNIEAKRKQSRNIAIGLGGSLVLGSVIAFLVYKNTKRKQLLAEQQKELETQKLATVLKEQELTSIDAMIEGQEKERQRIANELHDDLGGLMATVKLHFNALKDKQTPELYIKTNQLIDEAYNKVRTVAHAKNSGVIAKQGLLKAINEMAHNVSASNTIMIDVIDHGLENRLENSLELTIFRIVQELITNVIKHANATEVTIHITNHDDSLNLMIEDNGKGFNPSQITKTKKGMGISSIDKRIEHLNGTMTIESEKHQGTTIIIDIPI